MNRFDVLQELKSFKPYDAGEADSLTRTVAFIEKEPDAFKRSLKKGHVTGSALLVHDDGSVLLMHHKSLDRWQQFGGHADGDENILRVATRETIEESGIKNIILLSDGIADLDIHVIPDRPEKNEPAHPHYDIRYIFRTADKNFVVPKREAMGLEWMAFDQAFVRCPGAEMHRLLNKAKALML